MNSFAFVCATWFAMFALQVLLKAGAQNFEVQMCGEDADCATGTAGNAACSYNVTVYNIEPCKCWKHHRVDYGPLPRYYCYATISKKSGEPLKCETGPCANRGVWCYEKKIRRDCGDGPYGS